jgi:pimeloyl-ACP methyl ester carboxylesterase
VSDLAHEVVGDGPPLLLLHGFLSDRTTWRSAGYLERLPGRALILVDLRGRGESPRPHAVAEHAAERHVADLVALLDGLGVAQTAVWGASWGGTLGLRLYEAHPDRVERVMVTGAHAEPSPVDGPALAAQAAALREHGTAPLIAGAELPGWLRDVVLAQDPFALAAAAEALAGDVAPVLVPGDPVHFVVGELDPILPQVGATSTRIGAELSMLAGCDHAASIARADLAVDAARDFLSPPAR